MKWVKIHCEKWFMGSTRWELSPSERSVWIDFIVKAGINDPPGQINFFNLQQLATHLKIPLKLLEKSIEKFTAYGKISVQSNIIVINNWGKYQSYNIDKSNIKTLDKVLNSNIEKSTHRTEVDKIRKEEEKNRKEEEMEIVDNSIDNLQSRKDKLNQQAQDLLNKAGIKPPEEPPQEQSDLEPF